MTSSIELLGKALEKKTASQWARDLNITPSAITNARARGRLSPTLAGNLAIVLGEDPAHWSLVAALEAEPESPLLQGLKERLKMWRKLSLSDNTAEEQILPERRRRGIVNAVNRSLYDARRNIKHLREIRQGQKTLFV